jgi:Domain of unknown function (DUF4386)
VNPARKTSIVAGTLFVIATLAALAAPEVAPALTGNDYLKGVAEHPQRLAAAALLYLIAAGTSAGIAIALYPLLKKINAALALGSVVFRTIEAVFYAVAVVELLSVLPLSRQLATAAADDRAPIHVLADSLLGVRDHATLLGVFAFSAGALMYYSVFYRSRLVPRWLSGWGVAGVILMMAACVLALFSDRPITGYTFLVLPIAVQELILAGWLLVKGFNPSSPTSEVASESSTALRGTVAPAGVGTLGESVRLPAGRGPAAT